jgi:hypothetical protein
MLCCPVNTVNLVLGSSRIISHSDVQEYLTGRFYLSPSRLYSSVRLLPNKQGYEVPVAGDWVTICVIAERGPVKYSKAPIGSGKGSGKRYVNIKLVDFNARSRSSSSGGKAIRGDALLTLLLFESDGFDIVPGVDGKKSRKLYKGGSKGAFESMSQMKEGDVIALLNANILKPFQVGSILSCNKLHLKASKKCSVLLTLHIPLITYLLLPQSQLLPLWSLEGREISGCAPS